VNASPNAERVSSVGQMKSAMAVPPASTTRSHIQPIRRACSVRSFRAETEVAFEQNCPAEERSALTHVRVHIWKVAQCINNGFGFRNESRAIRFVWRKWNFGSHDERSRNSDAHPDAGSKRSNVQFIATVIDDFVRQCRASFARSDLLFRKQDTVLAAR
jgi:hypothetical protein